MRIAIIKSNYTPYGGAEKYTARLIKAFTEKDVHVDVLTAKHAVWDKLDKNISIVSLKQFRFNNLLRLVTFNASAKGYLKREKYDCILGMDNTDYQTHLRVGGGCHKAWLERRCQESSRMRCLSFKINPFHTMMMNIQKQAFLSEKLKRVFCNSNLVKNEMRHYYPQTSDKLTVIHNGVEWHELSEDFEKGLAEKNNILQSLNLKTDRFYYLFVGSGYERKGLGKAITAMKSLPEETALIVVGKDRNEKRYMNLADKLGLLNRVYFFGPQKNVIPFLQAAAAFILPTLYDPFSNAALEALAMGLYVITTDANGCAEVIKDRAGCVIKDSKNIDSISEAMRTALNSHLSKKEIRETVRHLDFKTQLNKIVDICLSDAKGAING